MRRILLLLFLLPLIVRGQDLEKDLLNRIKEIKSIPAICRSNINELYFSEKLKNDQEASVPLPNPSGCGDKVFWSIVKLKSTAIPLLIEKLDDTTSTTVAVPHKSFSYTVADISYLILKEIVDGLPEPIAKTNGRATIMKRDRVKFKKQISNWYINNKEYLIWVNSNEFNNCDCSNPHPNGGHFIVKK